MRVMRGLGVFLYCEESLVSSNLNSKLLRFHSVRPNVYTFLGVFFLLHSTSGLEDEWPT